MQTEFDLDLFDSEMEVCAELKLTRDQARRVLSGIDRTSKRHARGRGWRSYHFDIGYVFIATDHIKS
jgi:hypothetical protein